MADIVPIAFPSLPVPTFQLLGPWVPHQLPQVLKHLPFFSQVGGGCCEKEGKVKQQQLV